MSKSKTSIYCCGCSKEVAARLTDGNEIYPHRPDLAGLQFWKCDACGNFVGCHHKTQDRLRPLGCIPTAQIREARKQVHALSDPLWKAGKIKRRALYAEISKRVGWTYHAAEIRNVEECRKVSQAINEIAKEL